MPDQSRNPTKGGAPRPSGIRYPLLASLLLLASLSLWLALQRDPAPPEPDPLQSSARLVDEAQCQGCHAEQFQRWRGSHHQLAMQAARDDTVLGDFAGQSVKIGAEHVRFFRRDGGFWVHTKGPDGRPGDFRVAYVLGVEPLQQYLLELPGGRLQAFPLAWDVAARRWLQLYPEQSMDRQDPLHWSGPQQNANFMCIECHTTGFRRNFDPVSGHYASHWQALGVGCQSCHGPASKHLAWAAQPNRDARRGFALSLASADAPTQVESCGRCHARRAPLGDGFDAQGRLLDDYLPTLLTPLLYELDGKIKDEVFEWGSFTQSRMFAKGVRCTNCHDPHGARLKASGNALCLQCHNLAGKPALPGIDGRGLQARDYDTPEHHHHRSGQPGSQCVDCHMPGKFYMVRDFRHDHGFTLPNPARALKLGTPDACLGCHQDDSGEAIVQRFRDWYPDPPASGRPRYDESLQLIRNGLPGASRALLMQLEDGELPAIRRATLLAELPSYPSERTLNLALRDLGHADPLVRRAAIEAVSALLPQARRLAPLGPLLDDPVRGVRLAAAEALMALPDATLGPQQASHASALAEYEQSLRAQVDRAEANLGLARLYQARGRDTLVEPALRAALQRDPDYLPAVVALAQWLEEHARDGEARRLLDEALARHPQAALLHHAKGLALVRQGRREAGIAALAEAARLAPEEVRFGYAHAVARHDGGDLAGAIEQLERLLERQPGNREVRLALIDYCRESGQLQKVQVLQAELERMNPDDPVLRQLQ